MLPFEEKHIPALRLQQQLSYTLLTVSSAKFIPAFRRPNENCFNKSMGSMEQIIRSRHQVMKLNKTDTQLTLLCGKYQRRSVLSQSMALTPSVSEAIQFSAEPKIMCKRPYHLLLECCKANSGRCCMLKQKINNTCCKKDARMD